MGRNRHCHAQLFLTHSPVDRDRMFGVGGLIVGHCWDSSAVARNDSQGGLGRARMVAPCGWDSSAAARNDSQERLGGVRMVAPCRWDSSAAARNDSQERLGGAKGWLPHAVGIPRLPLGMADKRSGAGQKDGCPMPLGFLGCRSEWQTRGAGRGKVSCRALLGFLGCRSE